MCATSADSRIVPIRSATTKRNSRLSSRDRTTSTSNWPELDADVERQQRRQQVRAGELQRLAQREREAEAVHQSRTRRRSTPARAIGGASSGARVPRDDVLERHVDDRDGDQRLDERRKPERVGARSYADAISVTECATVKDVTTTTSERKPPERDHQAEQEQQVIDAVEDVEEAVLDEPQRRLMPARVEPDDAGSPCTSNARSAPPGGRKRSTTLTRCPAGQSRG